MVGQDWVVKWVMSGEYVEMDLCFHKMLHSAFVRLEIVWSLSSGICLGFLLWLIGKSCSRMATSERKMCEEELWKHSEGRCYKRIHIASTGAMCSYVCILRLEVKEPSQVSIVLQWKLKKKMKRKERKKEKLMLSLAIPAIFCKLLYDGDLNSCCEMW